ncbi:UDP-2,4-diacetamido-2,4,6-trideoxy-beta-L-altropyranose hydrolase [Lachnospiraceae bacterium JLR.KK009]|nr:pseudaminic acid biosynthesis-associated protein PseG [Lachnospiraceae bacterium A2]
MIYIRTDMNDIIATGHVMRCLAIAEAARAQGEDIMFLLADPQACSLLDKHGFPYTILHTCWDDMDSELPIIGKVIEEQRIEKILVDSYQVTPNYLNALTQMVKTLYIDDLNAFEYPVNALVCYANYGKTFYQNRNYQRTNLFLGTQYVPLRRNFERCGKKQINPSAENLILLSGGTDKYNMLECLLESIEIKKYKDIQVICGVYYPKYDYICGKYSGHQNIHVYKAVQDIEKHMEHADLAVAAGGTTLYELCALGVPTIAYAIADNQLDNVKTFHKDGIIDYAGDVREENVVGKINSLLNLYYGNCKLRQQKSEKMQGLVDGKGAWRIAEILSQM